MIYVNGVRFPSDSSSIEGLDMVNALLEHPHLVSASQSFRAVPERKFSVSEGSGSQGSVVPKCVYIFQSEYAIADPALVEVVGTDEATTCVGIVVRNCKSGMTSIAHMDSPKVVDIGLSQMLSLVSDCDDAILDVETSCGSVVPASFDRSTRCPDEIIRRIRLGASFEDPGCTGRLLETYETQTDRFVIAPFSWSMHIVHIAMMMRHRSDMEILLTTSTSPSAEGPDFVDNQKRLWQYLIQHPDWRETFPSKLPHIYERTASRNWVMSSEQ